MNMEKSDRCLRLFGVIGLGYLAARYMWPSLIEPLGLHSSHKWDENSFVIMNVVLSMILGCSRLKTAGIMWYCAIGWLLDIWVQHIDEPFGFLLSIMTLLMYLLQTLAYFVLLCQNRGLGLRLLFLSQFLVVLHLLDPFVRGSIYQFHDSVELIRYVVLSAAYLTFAFPEAASGERGEPGDLSPASKWLLRSAAVLGIVYAAYCAIKTTSSGCTVIAPIYESANIVFCMHFLLLFLSGRRAAGWGLAGTWLTLTQPTMILLLHSSSDYSSVQLIVANGLVVVSYVRLRKLFPCWARWCVAAWCSLKLLNCGLHLLPSAAGDPLAFGFNLLASPCHFALAAAYAGLLFCRRKAQSAETFGDSSPQS